MKIILALLLFLCMSVSIGRADCPAGTVSIPMYDFLYCYQLPNGDYYCEMQTYSICIPYVWDAPVANPAGQDSESVYPRVAIPARRQRQRP